MHPELKVVAGKRVGVRVALGEYLLPCGEERGGMKPSLRLISWGDGCDPGSL